MNDRPFRLQIRWGTAWVTLPGSFATRDDATWFAAEWRQAYRVGKDCFRVTPICPSPECPCGLCRKAQAERDAAEPETAELPALPQMVGM